MERIEQFLAWAGQLLDMSAESVAGTIVVLAATASLALTGRILAWLGQMIAWIAARQAARRERRLLMREVVIDILVHAWFDQESISTIIEPERLDKIREDIDADPEHYRAYLVPDRNDPTFDDYREVRHRFDTRIMAGFDRYMERSQLFHRYYAKMQSDDFAALPHDRKLKVVTVLEDLGKRCLQEYGLMVEAVEQDRTWGRIREEVATKLDSRAG